MGETRLLSSLAPLKDQRPAGWLLDYRFGTPNAIREFYDATSWDRIAAIEVRTERAATESPDVFSRG
jgi:hypothetical protein